TRRLNNVLDNEGRQRTVKMMWQVVYADERVNEFESNIIWRIADLLGVSSRQRIELRQRVVADRVALNPA
ncbi:MAG TPA: TerB family tellurite resistance protein, partial [Pseudolabrys sp.]